VLDLGVFKKVTLLSKALTDEIIGKAIKLMTILLLYINFKFISIKKVFQKFFSKYFVESN